MRTTWIVVSLLGGCTFQGALAGDGTPPDGGSVARRCDDSSDTHLKLCLEFEDPQPTATEHDGSSFHDDASVANVAMMQGRTDHAAQLSEDSSIRIGKTANLDPSDVVTFEMWLNPDPLRLDDTWTLDNDAEYGMALYFDGQIHCAIGSDTIDSGRTKIPDDSAWHHAACVYDHQRLEVFVDGQLSGCQDLDRSINTTGVRGTSIGSKLDSLGNTSQHYVGGLDGVRVYDRALSAAEVCSAAGGSGCAATCPTGHQD